MLRSVPGNRVAGREVNSAVNPAPCELPVRAAVWGAPAMRGRSYMSALSARDWTRQDASGCVKGAITSPARDLRPYLRVSRAAIEDDPKESDCASCTVRGLRLRIREARKNRHATASMQKSTLCFLMPRLKSRWWRSSRYLLSWRIGQANLPATARCSLGCLAGELVAGLALLPRRAVC